MKNFTTLRLLKRDNTIYLADERVFTEDRFKLEAFDDDPPKIIFYPWGGYILQISICGHPAVDWDDDDNEPFQTDQYAVADWSILVPKDALQNYWRTRNEVDHWALTEEVRNEDFWEKVRENCYDPYDMPESYLTPDERERARLASKALSKWEEYFQPIIEGARNFCGSWFDPITAQDLTAAGYRVLIRREEPYEP